MPVEIQPSLLIFIVPLVAPPATASQAVPPVV